MAMGTGGKGTDWLLKRRHCSAIKVVADQSSVQFRDISQA